METGYAVASDERQMAVPNKKKKIGFFKRWMLKSVKEAVDAERRNEVNVVGASDIISTRSLKVGRQESSIDQPERAIQFTVYTANGGRVIETRRYDRKTDRHGERHYLITDEQEFEKELGKFITLESMKQST